MSIDFNDEKQFREWAVNHHPSVKAALDAGRATLACFGASPDKVLWFGPEDGVVEMADSFLEYASAWTKDAIPHRGVQFGSIKLEYVGDSNKGDGEVLRKYIRKS